MRQKSAHYPVILFTGKEMEWLHQHLFETLITKPLKRLRNIINRRTSVSKNAPNSTGCERAPDLIVGETGGKELLEAPNTQFTGARVGSTKAWD